MIHRVARSKRWWYAPAGLALAVASCSPTSSGAQADGHAAAASTPTRPAPLAEARLASPALVVRLTDVARTSSEVLTIAVAVSNADPGAPVPLGAAFAASEIDAGSVADAFLFDEAHQKKYFVLRDREGRAACSPDAGAIAAGREREVWCRFPAPPGSVARISVSIPHLPMFRNIAIRAPSDGQGTR